MKETSTLRRIAFAIALVVCATLGNRANANTITPSTVLFPTPGVWAYAADHTSGELHAGDSFTIFDFGGYVAGTIYAPALWTTLAVLVGSSPAGAPLGPDNPSEYNLVFTYTGPSIETLGLLPLGLFGATTTYTSVVVDDWISQDHLIGTPGVVGDGGVGTIHRDAILVPGVVGVPDGGATVALLGAALIGLAAFRRKLSV